MHVVVSTFYMHVRQIASDIFVGEGDEGVKNSPYNDYQLVVCLKNVV